MSGAKSSPEQPEEERQVRAAARAANVFAGESIRAMQNGWETFSQLLDQAIPSDNEKPINPRDVQNAYVLAWNNYFDGMAQATKRASKELNKDDV